MTSIPCIAFLGEQRIAEGPVRDVARQVKLSEMKLSGGPAADSGLLIFNAETSEPIEIDLRGTVEEVLARLPVHDAPATAAPDHHSEDSCDIARRGPGRPKLGVIAREVTLLPRHWDWLAQQPGGASVTIRKLIEDARKTHGAKDRMRRARETAYRFASVMAGDRPHYEEAMRALFAGEQSQFEVMIQAWPPDIRDHVRRLSAPAFPAL